MSTNLPEVQEFLEEMELQEDSPEWEYTINFEPDFKVEDEEYDG